MIDRIGHINIRTPNLEETCSFYERLMGLVRDEAYALPDPERNKWLFTDSGRAIVHVNMPPEGEDAPPPQPPGRLNHVAFDCRDYDGMVKRLEDMGLDYKRYETALPGLVLLVTQDPNGIIVELSFGTDNAIHRSHTQAA